MSSVSIVNNIAATEQLIDDSIIDRYRQRGPRLISILVDAYLEEAPRYFQDLRQAASAGDMTGVKSAAHGLKSSSYNLGAVRLAKMCQETENAATADRSEEVADVVEQVGPVLFDTEEALKGIKSTALL